MIFECRVSYGGAIESKIVKKREEANCVPSQWNKIPCKVLLNFVLLKVVQLYKDATLKAKVKGF